ncbi:hypothetical protein [Parabacteroides sp. Marseille-P3160]|nr:hypothetical protein [Parabacteroides sp. Marseille-P3160]
MKKTKNAESQLRELSIKEQQKYFGGGWAYKVIDKELKLVWEDK